MNFWRALATLLSTLALAGCANLPPPPARVPDVALADPQSTQLGRLVQAAAPSPEQSGFRLLVEGHEAYGALAALADRAERSLDLQYYLIRSDASSRALMRRVYAAAERGVRVRLLLDDLNTAGQDQPLLRLSAHPNIEVRLYNPFPAGRVSTIGRVLASLGDVRRINQRMHNKMTVADGALAVTGGRNIGDAYFVHNPQGNFLDVDLLVAGPVVRGLSATFDSFWNSPAAYPVEAVSDTPALEPIETVGAQPGLNITRTPAPVPDTSLGDALARGELKLDWGEARVLADTPLKTETYTRDLASLVSEARRSVTLISPYFVPGPRGVAAAQALAARGVKLRILTNSLATTDATVVHVGYARYREALLATGAELHELRPRLGAPRRMASAFGSSHASLHAKVVVIDERSALVGSMNMDPRSQRLNTEVGVLVRSPLIARQLTQLFDEVCAGSTWRLSLAPGDTLRWTATSPDATMLSDEPEAGFWRKFSLKLLAPLAPDELL